MVALPDSLDLDPVSGAMPSTATVAPTDFGLGGIADKVERAAFMQRRTDALQIRVNAQQDRQAVQPDVLNFVNKVQDQFATDAPKWNGQPGFAADQIAKAGATRDKLAADPFMTAGQRSEFVTAANTHISQFGEQAIGHERNVMMQNAVDQQEVQLNGAKTSFMTAFAPAKQALIDGYDGSQKGLTDRTLAAFDQASAAVAPQVPPDLQPKFQAQMAAMRVEEAAQTGAIEQKGADAYVLKNSTAQAGAMINTIVSNPSAYDSVVSNLPGVVSVLPGGLAGMKKDLLREYTGEAAAAQVHGWINQGNPGQAAAALNDGRYDAFLDPQVKERLLTEAAAGARDKAPRSLDQALAQQQVEKDAGAEYAALVTTGRSTGFDPGRLGALPLEQQAKVLNGFDDARKQFAVVGAVRDMPIGQLQGLAASGPPKDTTSPTYEAEFEAWKVAQPAAQAELAARQKDPAGWAMTPKDTGATKGPGAAGLSLSTDRGAALQQMWAGAQQPGPGRAAAGLQFATSMRGAQQQAGIQASSRTLVPEATAAALAASVTAAPPEGKMKAMQDLSGLLGALPAVVKLPDGSYANPRSILAKQLLSAHVSPIELVAVSDFGAAGDLNKLGLAVAAINNPTLKTPLPGKGDQQLKTQIAGQLAPYATTIAPLEGVGPLSQARLDLAYNMARQKMATGGESLTNAAASSVKAWTDGYVIDGTVRVPTSAVPNVGLTVPHPVGLNPNNVDLVTDGAGLLRLGRLSLATQLLGSNGANLYAPSQLPGTPGNQRKAYAAALNKWGRWVTTPDERGVTFMGPNPDGTWYQVADRFGRAVTASWQQLQGYAQGHGAAPFAPPPGSATAPDGAPVPAFTKQAGFSALQQAVEQVESRGRTGLVSPAGAMGVMQVLPKSAGPIAQQLYGQPLDLHRLQYDDAYNRAIGTRILADNVNHYGATPGGLALATADYHAGRGNIEGYTDAKGYHPGMIAQFGDPRSNVSIPDWTGRIKATHPATSAYVGTLVPAALHALSAGH